MLIQDLEQGDCTVHPETCSSEVATQEVSTISHATNHTSHTKIHTTDTTDTTNQ